MLNVEFGAPDMDLEMKQVFRRCIYFGIGRYFSHHDLLVNARRIVIFYIRHSEHLIGSKKITGRGKPLNMVHLAVFRLVIGQHDI